MDIPFMKQQKSTDQLEDDIRRKKLEVESADLDFTLGQKREMLARLKAHGVTKSQVGGTWQKVWAFLKAH